MYIPDKSTMIRYQVGAGKGAGNNREERKMAANWRVVQRAKPERMPVISESGATEGKVSTAIARQ